MEDKCCNTQATYKPDYTAPKMQLEREPQDDNYTCNLGNWSLVVKLGSFPNKLVQPNSCTRETGDPFTRPTVPRLQPPLGGIPTGQNQLLFRRNVFGKAVLVILLGYKRTGWTVCYLMVLLLKWEEEL